MSFKIVVASALAAFGMHAAIAQEATPDTWMQVNSVKSRADVRHEVAVARANGDLDVLRQYDTVDRSYVPTLSRAEVLADLEIWRSSGMAALDRGEASYDGFSPAYRRAQARYAELRDSPLYAALVQSFASRRGETLASTRAASGY
jgi:hypothetical protein